MAKEIKYEVNRPGQRTYIKNGRLKVQTDVINDGSKVQRGQDVYAGKPKATKALNIVARP